MRVEGLRLSFLVFFYNKTQKRGGVNLHDSLFINKKSPFKVLPVLPLYINNKKITDNIFEDNDLIIFNPNFYKIKKNKVYEKKTNKKLTDEDFKKIYCELYWKDSINIQKIWYNFYTYQYCIIQNIPDFLSFFLYFILKIK